MTVFRLGPDPVFPVPELADPDGLLAIGGDLSPERLVAAYSNGIFPWFEDGQPILWWFLNPRCVLFPGELHVAKSLKKVINSNQYEITLDRDFQRVISSCATKFRPGQNGTWLVDDMIRAYVRLHQLGLAHSVEAWEDGELAGGMYGVSLGRVFFGESMFFLRPNASKVAFVTLVNWLKAHDFDLIDCQQTTPHMLKFGAREIPRDEFLDRLERALEHRTLAGKWQL